MEIQGKTEIVGLIGWPVSHSISPPMHNAAFSGNGVGLVLYSSAGFD